MSGRGQLRIQREQYPFKLYALDTDIELGPEVTKEDLPRTIDGHILAGGKPAGKLIRGDR